MPSPARRSSCVVALATALTAPLATAVLAASGPPAGPTTDFAAGPDGWTIVELPGPPYDAAVDTFAPVFQPVGGNPGGCIQTTDQDGTLFMFGAPSAFTGDQSAFIGGHLRYDLQFADNGLPPGSIHPDVVLHGAGLTLLIDAFRDPPTQTGQWETYTVPLSAAAGWRRDTVNGPPVTGDEFLAAMSSLDAVLIRGDFWAGAETTRLDNPALAPGLPADLDGDGDVDTGDLISLLSNWGTCPPPPADCPADLNGDGAVDVGDLLVLLASWSP